MSLTCGSQCELLPSPQYHLFWVLQTTSPDLERWWYLNWLGTTSTTWSTSRLSQGRIWIILSILMSRRSLLRILWGASRLKSSQLLIRIPWVRDIKRRHKRLEKQSQERSFVGAYSTCVWSFIDHVYHINYIYWFRQEHNHRLLSASVVKQNCCCEDLHIDYAKGVKSCKTQDLNFLSARRTSLFRFRCHTAGNLASQFNPLSTSSQNGCREPLAPYRSDRSPLRLWSSKLHYASIIGSGGPLALHREWTIVKSTHPGNPSHYSTIPNFSGASMLP